MSGSVSGAGGSNRTTVPTAFAQTFPQAPLVDPKTGYITEAWRYFFIGLLGNKTGFQTNVTNVVQPLIQEAITTQGLVPADLMMSEEPLLQAAAPTVPGPDAGLAVQLAFAQDQPEPVPQRYILAAFVPGTWTAGQVLFSHTFGAPVELPQGFGLCRNGTQSRADALVAATSGATATAYRCPAGSAPTNPANWISVGTVSWAAGAYAGAFAAASAVAFGLGDMFKLVATTADTTLTNVDFAIAFQP